MAEEQQEELSFEDAFNEIVDEAEGVTEQESEPVIEADEPEAAQEEEQPEQPRDEQGRFTTQEPMAEQPQTNPEIERYKREAQQWQHRYNSDLGRQRALQQKIQEQQQQIAKLQEASQKAPEGSGMSQKQWDTLKEDFPEIAAAMESKLNSISSTYESKISRLEQQLQPIQAQAHQNYRQGQFDQLSRQHPDWQSIAQSSEFSQWMQTQPKPVQALYNSNEAADAAYLIGTYKAHKGIQSAGSTDELKQRRQRQLQQGQTISNRGGRPKSSLPPEDDFESAFNYFADKG